MFTNRIYSTGLDTTFYQYHSYLSTPQFYLERKHPISICQDSHLDGNLFSEIRIIYMKMITCVCPYAVKHIKLAGNNLPLHFLRSAEPFFPSPFINNYAYRQESNLSLFVLPLNYSMKCPSFTYYY